MRNEIWKKIERYPDYEISNLGRIKSYKRNKIKILSNCRDSDGYSIIKLSKNKKRDNIRIHRLVLETFNPIENMDELQVNHINGIKDDNRYPENIQWCTQSENEKHAHNLGLKNFKGNMAFNRGNGKNNPFYGKNHSEKTKNILREKRKGRDDRSLWWEITEPDGNTIRIRNLKKFCRENNFGYSNIIVNNKCKGYSFRKINSNE